MSLVRTSLTIALLVALPVEAVTFWLFMPPLADDLGPGTPLYVRLMGAAWAIFHMPGIMLIQWFGSSIWSNYDLLVLFLTGYVEAAALLFAAMLLYRRLNQRAR